MDPDIHFSRLCLVVTPTTAASSCWLRYLLCFRPDLPPRTYLRLSHPEKHTVFDHFTSIAPDFFVLLNAVFITLKWNLISCKRSIICASNATIWQPIVLRRCNFLFHSKKTKQTKNKQTSAAESSFITGTVSPQRKIRPKIKKPTHTLCCGGINYSSCPAGLQAGIDLSIKTLIYNSITGRRALVHNSGGGSSAQVLVTTTHFYTLRL